MLSRTSLDRLLNISNSRSVSKDWEIEAIHGLLEVEQQQLNVVHVVNLICNKALRSLADIRNTEIVNGVVVMHAFRNRTADTSNISLS